MKILCPSKTFLMGEYAVLSGGPAILLATPPYFSWDNEGFFDPYEGLGGFGGSGAEFVINAKRQGVVDPWKLLDNYHKKSLSGSGADIICQWTGGISYFYKTQKVIQKINWPFESLLIGLIHTGYKIKTHEHLENLIQTDFSELGEIVINSYDSMHNKNQKLFLETISAYHHALDKLGLVSDTTKSLLNTLNKNNIILASKGCGAMGADVILVMIEKQNKDKFEQFCKKENLNLVYCDNQFAEGVRQYD